MTAPAVSASLKPSARPMPRSATPTVAMVVHDEPISNDTKAQSRQAETAGQTEPGGDAAAWPEAVNPTALTEEGLSLPERLRRIEADLIDEAMERNGGNISRAAAELGIKRQGLQYKLREREKK